MDVQATPTTCSMRRAWNQPAGQIKLWRNAYCRLNLERGTCHVNKLNVESFDVQICQIGTNLGPIKMQLMGGRAVETQRQNFAYKKRLKGSKHYGERRIILQPQAPEGQAVREQGSPHTNVWWVYNHWRLCRVCATGCGGGAQFFSHNVLSAVSLQGWTQRGRQLPSTNWSWGRWSPPSQPLVSGSSCIACWYCSPDFFVLQWSVCRLTSC